jgi:predicted RNase H-like HicB family nuclease
VEILMSFQPLEATATWDSEAKVWVAESDDVPGLVTEASTREELLPKLEEVIPAPLEENNRFRGMSELPYSLIWQEQEFVHLKRA